MKLDVPFYSQRAADVPEVWHKRACGIADIKMALEYYGFIDKTIIAVEGEMKRGMPSIGELIEEGVASGAYLDGVGWKHDGLIALARTHGLEGYRKEFKEDKEKGIVFLKEALGKKHLPVVSVSKKHSDATTFHLVLLTGFDEKGFYYNDSSFESEKEGKDRLVSFEDFTKLWRGLAMFFHT